MIEIDGKQYRTEKQWERVHRHVLKRQREKGIEREWRSPKGGNDSAIFYCIEQTRPWPESERRRERRAKAEARAAEELAEKLAECEYNAKEQQRRQDAIEAFGLRSETVPYAATYDHTAYQWCELGFVPIAESRWRRADNGYFYCAPWDVRWNPEKAKQLLKTGPRTYDGRPYNGRPWWDVKKQY